ncbi:MAG: type III pantothenate kinase [Acidiferrobacterales bacterium]|nr:type III pantothenate kinase [Acidiferrobacterales bacterium]
MNLLVDIGNQYVKWLFGDRHGSFDSSSLESCITEYLRPLGGVTGIYFVNVAGTDVSERFRNCVRPIWGLDPVEIFSQPEQCGVKNCYRQVHQLGADRWVAAIAAWHTTRTATIIVDCGTAVTVDALSDSAEFIGGSIMPGIGLAMDSLYRRAPGVRESSDQMPAVIPATATTEAVATGVIFSSVGGIELLVDKYREVAGESSRLLITGGDAPIIQQHTSKKFEYMPNLVLEGISIIADSTS